MTDPNIDPEEFALMQAIVLAAVRVIADPSQRKIDDMALQVAILGDHRAEKK
ncbi:hypothetical protein LCGC14_1215790 [marine sediment metagenome]|uniref:Uncharacterized protein n=1 Tax=marine sediment metagenome TaxID=412755 RepID=A0A0F9LGV0_9ZZZZ